MRILSSIMLIAYAHCLCASDIDIAKVPGHWMNIDKDSDGILAVIIENEDNGGTSPHHRFSYVVKAQPQSKTWPCSLVSYMSENVTDARRVVKGFARQDDSKSLVSTFIFTLTRDRMGDEFMELDEYTIFGEGDARPNFVEHYTFKHQKPD